MTTTIERPPREFVREKRGYARVIVHGPSTNAHEDDGFDRFVEQMRVDVFALYATVRAVQRDQALPVSRRLWMLGLAAQQATALAREIDLYAIAASTEDDRGFGVPI